MYLKNKVKNAETDYGKILQRSRKGSCKQLNKAISEGFEAMKMVAYQNSNVLAVDVGMS
jgi:hypothetical protein